MLWFFQHSCQFSCLVVFWFPTQSVHFLLGLHVADTLDESKIPRGFMSVMWKRINVLPLLSAVPADTSYVKYGHVSPLNQALNVGEVARETQPHPMIVRDYKHVVDLNGFEAFQERPTYENDSFWLFDQIARNHYWFEEALWTLE